MSHKNKMIINDVKFSYKFLITNIANTIQGECVIKIMFFYIISKKIIYNMY